MGVLGHDSREKNIDIKPVFHSRISPFIKLFFRAVCDGQQKMKILIFNNWAAEQVSSATHERKKIISMSKFFASGGEMMEWKTALRYLRLRQTANVKLQILQGNFHTFSTANSLSC